MHIVILFEDYVVTSSENSNNYFRLKDKEEYSKIFWKIRGYLIIGSS